MKINIAKKNVIKILIDLEFLTLDSFSETVLGKIQRSRSLKRSVSYAVYDIRRLSTGVPIASELFLTVDPISTLSDFIDILSAIIPNTSN